MVCGEVFFLLDAGQVGVAEGRDGPAGRRLGDDGRRTAAVGDRLVGLALLQPALDEGRDQLLEA
jgi:hypothetical protein